MQSNMHAYFVTEGPHVMHRLPDLATNPAQLSAADPCRYVSQADLALLYGSREEAAAMIAQAYLAFDLALANCDDITGWGKVW